MKSEQELRDWLKESKALLEETENNKDMPQGDFNDLELEVEILEAILGN